MSGGRTIGSLVVVLVNVMLQFFVLWKVEALTKDHSEELEGRVFGLCYARSETMPFHKNLKQDLNPETVPADGKYAGEAG